MVRGRFYDVYNYTCREYQCIMRAYGQTWLGGLKDFDLSFFTQDIPAYPEEKNIL
jgi:hypothetical protein